MEVKEELNFFKFLLIKMFIVSLGSRVRSGARGADFLRPACFGVFHAQTPSVQCGTCRAWNSAKNGALVAFLAAHVA